MSDDIPQSDLVTAAVTAVSLPENFSIPQCAALARDLAISMYDRPIILKKHGVSEAQCVTLEAHPYFKKLLEIASIEWNGPRSIQERLALEAAVGVEQSLPDIIARLSNKHENLGEVVQGLKVICEIAGVGGANKGQAAPTERFSIHIDLGAGNVEVYDKTRPDAAKRDAPVIDLKALDEVQPLVQGLGALLALSPKPETP